MITITFESHATTTDNANHVSSGHFDVELSELGVKQAHELGGRYANDHFDAIYCSDLKRSYGTAEIAFVDRGWPIIRDAHLRECDYGDLTQHPSSEVDPAKGEHITTPFPNGESYEDTTRRVGHFLRGLASTSNGQRIMIIGHRATQYGLEYWLSGVPVAKAVTAPWKWQPGWMYALDPKRFEF